jgi:hypothetical protein
VHQPAAPSRHEAPGTDLPLVRPAPPRRSAGAYKAPSGASYLFSSEEMVQGDAAQYCQERGGHLVTYSADGDQSALEGMADQRNTEKFFQDAGGWIARWLRPGGACRSAGARRWRPGLGDVEGQASGRGHRTNPQEHLAAGCLLPKDNNTYWLGLQTDAAFTWQ